MASAVAIKVLGTVMTSSPGPTPDASSASPGVNELPVRVETLEPRVRQVDPVPPLVNVVVEEVSERIMPVRLNILGNVPFGYAYSTPRIAPENVTVSGASSAVQRVELPFEAYRDARLDLAVVRVLYGRGEAVPIAFAGDPDRQRETLPLVPLASFPVSTLVAAPGARDAEVTVRTRDGTLVAIRGKTVARSARPAAYLLDASAIAEPLRAVHFEWDAGPGTEVVKVRLESSDDLKGWSGLASGPLVRVENAGRTLSQPRLEFTPRKARYLRVTGDAPGFVLKEARAERETPARPGARRTRTVQATPGAKALPCGWASSSG